ncbi:cytochrome P450 9e2-like [Formica exsecta]|uniref:cytochrome P450 9e2-like n=1 Tax=Formica exsecta TaxID=72781 RepID=UPI0011418158|nr:cytochrome P450 9e2-like [Formica exsecta]
MELFTLILILLAACVCLHYFILSKLLYFKRQKVPYMQPIPLLGNMALFIFRRMSWVDIMQRAYNLFPDVKYFGFYDFVTPVYVIRDPDLITAITITNFDNFCDHRNFVNGSDAIVNKNLFDLRGNDWRKMRKLLSPSFTSGKIKMMFGLVCEAADNFSNFLATESGKIGKTYNMKTTLCRYANDVVATCAFGISVDSFQHPNNEFYVTGMKIFNFDGIQSFMIFLNRNFPLLMRLLKLKMFSPKVLEFFKNVVSDTVKIRDEQGIYRPDMIQLMMETRNKDHGSAFNIDEMAAQAFLFFLGGFDSVSTNMCFLTREIAINPDIQDRLRAEVDDVLRRTNGKLTYEVINDMKYLDAVVNENLRQYPLLTVLDRVCVKEFELPPAIPNGKPITVKPGTSIWIPNHALHHDSYYYPQPDKFDPDRFLNGDVNSSVYMPFGIGPRICIAKRFALMEMKVMLFHLLWRCDLEPDAKTRIPMVFSKKAFFMTAEGGFWLKLRARKSKAPVAHECLSNGQRVQDGDKLYP